MSLTRLLSVVEKKNIQSINRFCSFRVKIGSALRAEVDLLMKLLEDQFHERLPEYASISKCPYVFLVIVLIIYSAIA